MIVVMDHANGLIIIYINSASHKQFMKIGISFTIKWSVPDISDRD